MKKWIITIKAQDEASALVYLDMVKSTFKASVIMGTPMDHCVMEDPAKGEKTVCTLERNNIFSFYEMLWLWLRR